MTLLPPRERFTIAFGAFEPSVDTRVRIDSVDGTIGTEINLEDDLALQDRKTLPIFIFRWNIKQRMGLEVSYFALKRDGTVVLQKDIEFDGTLFPIGTTVDSTFDTTVFRVGYTHDVVQKEKNTLSLVGGIHFTDFETSINDTLLGVEEEQTGLVPLPMLGLHYRYRFSDRWAMGIRAEFLDLTFEDYDGHIENFTWNARFKIRKQWSFLFGYTHYDLTVSEEGSGFHGEIAYRYKGPSISLAASF